MAKKIAFLLGMLTVAGMIFVPWGQVIAARGTPGSSEFGFGAQIRLDGAFIEESLRLAGDLNLDWLSIEISWRSLQPGKDSKINWTPLEAVLKAASHSEVALLVSLTGAPDWAITPNGPESARVVQLVELINSKFGNTIKAIELFPGANTRSGWGASPSPKAYLALYQAVKNSLQSTKSKIILAAGGLVPVGASSGAEVMDDLVFLDGLYKGGPKTDLPVISIQLGDIVGTPMTGATRTQPNVLRHYEQIREVMLSNNQERGLIWVTHLHPPLTSSATTNSSSIGPAGQSEWMVQAFQQMRAQLYLGVAFLDSINPPAGAAQEAFSLITPAGDFHPSLRYLRNQIVQNSAGSIGTRPGQAKSAPLSRIP